MADDEITLAVLKTELRSVCDKIDRADERTHEKLDRIDKNVRQINDTVDAHAERITRVEERLKVWTGIQSTLSVILSGIAGYLGVRN